MPTFRQIGAAAIAAAIAIALLVDTADARRGGGGGGMRAGGFNRGGTLAGSRVAGSFTRVSNPIANRPDFGRPGRPDVGLPGRPGNRPGWGGGWGGDYRPGYGWGWGAAAVGAGLAYTAATDYCDPYYASNGYCNYGYESYAPAYGNAAATYENSDAIADCARRFRSYDPASQTYLSYSGQRISCP